MTQRGERQSRLERAGMSDPGEVIRMGMVTADNYQATAQADAVALQRLWSLNEDEVESLRRDIEAEYADLLGL